MSNKDNAEYYLLKRILKLGKEDVESLTCAKQWPVRLDYQRSLEE